MKYQRGAIQILLIAGIIVALGIIGFVIYTQKASLLPKTSFFNPNSVPSKYQPAYNQSGQAVGAIKGSGDLNAASASLDATDMTQLDTHLNALNSASSGF